MSYETEEEIGVEKLVCENGNLIPVNGDVLPHPGEDG